MSRIATSPPSPLTVFCVVGYLPHILLLFAKVYNILIFKKMGVGGGEMLALKNVSKGRNVLLHWK